LRAAATDVIVLDLKMPGMDGLETLREVRRLDPHVQVIVLTGHGTVATGIDGMQLGAADFLQKPTSIEQLCIAIEVAAIRARESRSAAGEGGRG
jgi:DNA-binding NtrC family response regulator